MSSSNPKAKALDFISEHPECSLEDMPKWLRNSVRLLYDKVRSKQIDGVERFRTAKAADTIGKILPKGFTIDDEGCDPGDVRLVHGKKTVHVDISDIITIRHVLNSLLS